MSIEDRLAAELGSRADRLGTPHVEVSGLERLGRRERRRRRTAWASAGAAVAAAVVIGGVAVLAQPDARTAPGPDPATDPPSQVVEEPGALPYLLDGTLHLGDRRIAVDPDWQIAFAGGTTLVGRQWEGPWAVVEGDRLVGLPTGITTPVGVILSDDGTLAAWVNTLGRTAQRVVLWDLVADAEIDRVEVEVEPDFRDQLSLTGIDLLGRVTWSTNVLENLTVWRPGSEPVLVTGLPGFYQRAWPGGVVAGGRYGGIGDDGRFTVVGRVEDANGSSSLWSPDGTTRVQVSGTSAVLLDLRQDAVIQFPDLGVRLSSVSPRGWVSPTQVVLAGPLADSDDGQQALVLCDVTTVLCEPVDEDVPGDAQLPDRWW
ncbi:hypothetical protein [Nocardioides sp.]|uniref:hypothetical protein n=1 Tax=Nocardioides sp. TaxID=35761 RepID=UPI00286BE982|nr:hypothetical protein [Nocardioides sp.]